VRAEEGGCDVFVVGICAVDAFEGRDERSTCCGGDWDMLDGIWDILRVETHWPSAVLKQCRAC
jgi:hypothetical protein